MVRIASAPLLIAVMALSSPANAEDGTAGAKDLLVTLESGGDRATLTRAAAELAASSANHLDELSTFLGRPRQSTDADRRAVLKKIRAAVPDSKGKFRTPKRMSAGQKQKEEEFDWLARLIDLPPSKARDESIADVAVVRALSASRQPAGAGAILDFAFTEVGIVYRDECGRYLRRMAPYSLPPLIMASQLKRKVPSKARYSTYQLERLDRQNPKKALAAADPELKVTILKSFADSGYREAIYATLAHTDHLNPTVRKAARDAWMEYVAGKPPRKAPKRRLQMPGGKLSKKREPLWLDHRELADIELRRRIEELVGKAPAEGANLKAMTAELFAFFDKRRTEKLDAIFKRGADLAGKNQSAEAALLFDQVLAQQPDFDRRNLMAPSYFRAGKQLQKDKKWKDAAAAFAKAHSVDPDGERGKEALAAHHYSRGMMKGDAGKADIARAAEIDPDEAGGAGKRWMLYGGIVWFVAGVLLLALGLHLRRRKA